MLTRYLERHYPQAAAAHQRAFERLLELSDPDLLAKLLGQNDTDDKDVAAVLQTIRDAEGADW